MFQMFGGSYHDHCFWYLQWKGITKYTAFVDFHHSVISWHFFTLDFFSNFLAYNYHLFTILWLFYNINVFITYTKKLKKATDTGCFWKSRYHIKCDISMYWLVMVRLQINKKNYVVFTVCKILVQAYWMSFVVIIN